MPNPNPFDDSEIEFQEEPFKPRPCDFCGKEIKTSEDWVCEEADMNACQACAARFAIEDKQAGE